MTTETVAPEWVREDIDGNTVWRPTSGDLCARLVVIVEKRPIYEDCPQYWRCEVKAYRGDGKDFYGFFTTYTSEEEARRAAQDIMDDYPNGFVFTLPRLNELPLWVWGDTTEEE